MTRPQSETTPQSVATPRTEAVGERGSPLGRAARAGFLLALAALLVNAAAAAWNVRRVAEAERRVGRTHRTLEAVAATFSLLQDAETGQRGYVLTGDPAFLTPYDRAVGRVRDRSNLLADLADDGLDASGFDRLVAAKLRELDETVALVRGGDAAAARAIVAEGRGRRLMDEIRSVVDAAAARERAELADREEAANRAVGLGLAGSLAAAALGGGVIVVAYLSLRREADAREAVAAELARQRELFEVTLLSIGDGVIATDAAGTVTSLNAIAERLTGRPAADARGRPLAEVFEIVNEETRAAVPNPVDRVLAEGIVVGLANHTLLIAADGTERPIDDSAAPIRGTDGRLLGAVLVFRDVTESRRAERALRASEGRFRFLTELGDATRGLVDPEAVMAVAARMLGRHLAASRCAYADVEADSEQFTIRHDYADGCPSTVGDYHLSLFGPRATADMREGRTLLIRDVDRELPAGEGREMFGEIGIKAIVCCPLVRGGRLVAMMAVHQTAPRQWTADEVSLVEAVVERSWAYIERARADRDLRESEERYRTLFESIDEGFCVIEMLYDGDGRPADYRFLEANPAFDRHTSLTGAVGRTMLELVPDHDANWFEIYGRVVATGEPVRFENEAKALGGRWFDLYAFRLGGPDSRRVAVLFKEITDRKRADESLRQAERQFRTLADSIPQLAWMAGPDGHLFWYNRRWYDYTGTTLEQMEGWGWQRVHDPAELPRVVENWNAALASGAPWEDVFPLRRHDGEMRWHLSRALPLRDDRGEIVRWFGTNTDVTEQRRLESELREADRRKDQFLATLAHELRNPLAPISNGLAAWPFVKDDPAEMDRLRDAMARQVEQMKRLIDDLLDVSRITRGKIALRPTRTDLGAVLDAGVEATRPFVDARGHRLTVSLPDPPPILDADFARLVQVFANLIHNAAKYADDGGRIDVAVRVEADPDGRSRAAVIVSDDGPGLPPDMLGRIFEMFTQVDQTLERAHGGLGIGLTLVKTLVELHGGTVTAASDGPGTGSTFTVTLPVAAGAGPASPAALPEPAEPVRPARVLVVDDMRPSGRTLGLMLKGIGQEVRVEHDGPTALAAAAEFRPHVVLLDIAMPGMDGYEVCRRLRAGSADDARPFLVALTGYGQEEDRRRAFEAGFDRHLVKPTSLAALKEVLAAAALRDDQRSDDRGSS